MLPIKCTSSHTEHITNKQNVQINERPYSLSCSEITTNDQEPPIEGPENPLSESVCAFCKQDHIITLPKLGIYPVCDNCKLNIDRSIFPTWVKLFFAGVLVLVVFSIFWNWRFYSAYTNVRKANKAYAQKNIANAANFMGKAAEQVPETKDLAEMAAYFKGIDLLIKDKSTAALAEFDKCKDLSPDFHINQYVLQAEIGSGFDKKDYKLFLKASMGFLQLDTTQAQSWAGVSSAYACLYAQNNVDSLKQLSLKYFNKAKAIDDTSAAAKEYYELIQHRLDSRQIITREQLHQKFPHGYTSSN